MNPFGATTFMLPPPASPPMRRWAPLVAALLLAGCLAQDPPPQPASAPPPGVVIDESRPDTAFTDVVTGPAAQPDLNATLAAPPRLVAGEWWRLRLINGEEVVRVVAEVTDEGYVVGMPHEGWYKELISFHSPALGDVGFDLSYATHNEIFQPVKFPLEQGATWDTVWATVPFAAEVGSVEGTRATIVLTPTTQPQPTDPIFALFGFTGAPVTLVYDATMHEVVKFDAGGFLGYEVLAHGYGFEGWVTIPRGEHTAIDYGQIGPTNPGELPMREIEVAGGFNRLTLMQGVFAMTPGVYRVRTIAPDGTEFLTEATTEPTLQFFEAADPDGIWRGEDVVAGGAAVYRMGIAYHQYDILLPDGTKRSDHSHEVIR